MLDSVRYFYSSWVDGWKEVYNYCIEEYVFFYFIVFQY